MPGPLHPAFRARPSYAEMLKLAPLAARHPRLHGCVGWYEIVENAGTSLTNWMALLPRGLPLLSGVAWATALFDGPVIRFNAGATSYADETTVDYDVVPPWSISLWLKMASTTGALTLAVIGNASHEQFLLCNSTNFQAATQGAAGFAAASATGAANLIEIFHVVGVWASHADRRIYVNGTLRATNTTNNVVTSATSHLRLARRYTTAQLGNYWLGSARIYRRELSAGEVASLYTWPYLEVDQARAVRRYGSVSPLVIAGNQPGGPLDQGLIGFRPAAQIRLR